MSIMLTYREMLDNSRGDYSRQVPTSEGEEDCQRGGGYLKKEE
jgi:hypothetical protein